MSRISDEQLVQQLGLSYQDIATGLGVSRQAVRNSVIRGGYLTLDRLSELFKKVEDKSVQEEIRKIIQDRLPWNAPVEQKFDTTNYRLLSTAGWESVWLIAPAISTVVDLIRDIARTTPERDQSEVALLLPRIGDPEIRQIQSLFRQTDSTRLRLALAELPYAALFPSVALFNPHSTDEMRKGYFVLKEHLAEVPADQLNGMVQGGLYSLDPWRDNETWGLTNVFTNHKEECVIHVLPGAESIEEQSDYFELTFEDASNQRGAVKVELDNTRTGWWITLQDRNMDEHVTSIALFGEIEGREVEIIRAKIEELPIRRPWPLADWLPMEVLKKDAATIRMEIV